MNLIKDRKRRKFINENLNWDNGNPATNGEYFMITAMGRNWKQCFDIGANRGEYTQALLVSAPDAEIISFEPNANSAKYIKGGRRVRVEVAAVGNKMGELTININRDDDTQSSSYRINEHTDPVKVPQLTLDSYLDSNNLERVDFIKIDTEGHELAVFKGARASLDEQKINLIQFEYGGTYKDAGTRLEDVYSLLHKNYIVCHILSQGILPLAYEPSLETYRYSNWLAISKTAFNKRRN